MNFHAIRAIYVFELARTRRTLLQSIAAPVLSTSLYFIVFGSAIGGSIATIDGVSCGAFIVPGLIMLAALSESVSNASFGIYIPRFAGTIYELLSAPVSVVELLSGFVGAAAKKTVLLGLLILATARLFVPFDIAHPLWAGAFFRPRRHRIQSFGLHHRHLGGRFRKAASRALDDHFAADIPRRHLLFYRNAALSMAPRRPIQSDRLSGQRLLLGVLREGRRRRCGQFRYDDRFHHRVHRGDHVDFQGWISVARMTPALATSALKPDFRLISLSLPELQFATA